LPRGDRFPALENLLPNLCADRIDYNIQGAYYQGFITYEEALAILHDLQFSDTTWVSTNSDLMKKLIRFSLFMTEDCWGSATNYVTSRWLADAILRGMQLGTITHEELHFGTDQEVWDKLLRHNDPIIRRNMQKVIEPHPHFALVDFTEGDMIVKSKFRGIDPLVFTETECIRMTSLDAALAEEYNEVKKRVQKGWPIKLLR